MRKKKPFLALNNTICENPKKSLFLKGVNPCFWSKNASYLVYLDLVKIRLETMLSTFAEKKETFLTIKNNFSKSKQSYFSKGLTHPFKHKMPISFFIYH